jgi:hypothetical protein
VRFAVEPFDHIVLNCKDVQAAAACTSAPSIVRPCPGAVTSGRRGLSLVTLWAGNQTPSLLHPRG